MLVEMAGPADPGRWSSPAKAHPGRGGAGLRDHRRRAGDRGPRRPRTPARAAGRRNSTTSGSATSRPAPA
ncbi:hypothetical protein HBB16_13115 [Pseudonocardia sp. MCCB 268]|nr:hypothetical protein [Pseudonocardia cytotoxica]